MKKIFDERTVFFYYETEAEKLQLRRAPKKKAGEKRISGGRIVGEKVEGEPASLMGLSSLLLRGKSKKEKDLFKERAPGNRTSLFTSIYLNG